MTRAFASACTAILSVVMVVSAAGSGLAQQRAVQDSPQNSSWYFVGDTDSKWSGAAPSGRDPFLTLNEADAGAPRYEFVLTLSDDPDPEQLRFTTGQSYALEGRSEMYTFLVNRSFDWDNDSPITPHFMAGLGMTYTDDQGVADLARRTDFEASAWQPAFQFGFGASYEISTSWALVARYRALLLGADTLVSDREQDSQFTQDFMIGGRIRF